jgi:cell division protein FtsZ
MGKSDFASYQASIKVVGVGGGGCNAVNRMIQNDIKGVEFIVANSDAQDLEKSICKRRIQIGPKLTRGLGVGGDWEVGQKAAEESREELGNALCETDLLFVTAGMGGGTGTGAAPVIADIGKQSKVLTIGIVTKPFTFEGSVRRNKAEEGIANLVEVCDTVIVIPNDRLLSICDYRVSVEDAFTMADEVLRNGVQSISELLTVPGLINLDFADVKAIMTNAGQAWMAIGKGSGPNRATDAAKAAISSPLLDVSIEGAKGVLLNITGDNSLSISEVNEAAELIRCAVDPKANIIFGVAQNEALQDEVHITLVATGFPNAKNVGMKTETEDQIRQKLMTLKDDDDLDSPTFLRNPLPTRKKQTLAFNATMEFDPSHNRQRVH